MDKRPKKTEPLGPMDLLNPLNVLSDEDRAYLEKVYSESYLR